MADTTEHRLLSSMLMAQNQHSDTLAALTEKIKSTNFSNQNLAFCFVKIREFLQDSEAIGGDFDIRINMKVFLDWLDANSWLAKCGGASELIGLLALNETFANADRYQRLFAHEWRERKMATDLSAVVGAPRDRKPDMLKTALNDYENSNPENHSDPSSMAGQLAKELLHAEWNRPMRDRIKSGVQAFDAFVRELRGGSIYTISGSVGSGKTAFGVTIALNAAKQIASEGLEGFVLVASLEQTRSDLSVRFLSQMTGLSDDRLRYREFSDSDMIGKVEPAMDELDKLPLRVVDGGHKSLTVEEIVRQIELHAQLGRPRVVLVDFIQIIGASEEVEDMVRISSAMEKLLGLAKKYNMAIILMSQLNKDVGQQKMAKPTAQHNAGSAKIEQLSAVNVAVVRPSYIHLTDQIPPFLCHLLIVKNRFGKTASVDVCFDGARSLIRDMTKDELKVVAEFEASSNQSKK